MPSILMDKKEKEQVEKFKDALTKLSDTDQERFSDWMDGFNAGLGLGQINKREKAKDEDDPPAA